MKKFVVQGGKALHGEVFISGSKNAAVGIVPASILTGAECLLENVPNVSDIRNIIKVLQSLGAECEFAGNVLKVDSYGVNKWVADEDAIGKMRGSSYLMGALLGRFHKASVCLPGGCSIGPRPIDQHLKGFRLLGATIKEEFGRVEIEAPNGLHGANIFLDSVSVGATINIMLAACMAEGNTIIDNCAMEPHVVDVANFLNTCGANIRGAGTTTIKIHGVERLHGGFYSVIPDQIEAGTYMVAIAATHGDAYVKNVIPRHQEALTAKLEEMNVGVEEGSDWIRIYDKGAFNGSNVKTSPYPGFPTDMQPQIVTLMALSNGTSSVKETIWDSRFSYVSDLNRMGADIKLADKSAIINGGKHLRGTHLKCPDLRAGAAFVIAALAATGESMISDIKYIDRGYEEIEVKLRAMGADIERLEIAEEES